MTVRQLKEELDNILFEYSDIGGDAESLEILMVLEGDGRKIEGPLKSIRRTKYENHLVIEFSDYE